MHKTAIWDRTLPHLHINCSLCVQEGSRVPNLSTEFNYLDSFKSYGIFSDFVVPVVPTLSLSSPHCPCHPHIVPVIPISSPCHPHHPHIIPTAPRRSPCGPYGCGLRGLHPMLFPWSPQSPCHPCCPHIIPIVPTSSPHHLEGSNIIYNPPDTHCTHPPPPWGWGAPNQ